MIHKILTIFVVVAFNLIPVMPAFAEDYSAGYNEIEEILAGPGNFASHNRSMGMISDLLRVQKRLFIEKHGNILNEVAGKTEELINEGSLYASEQNYVDCFKSYSKALNIVRDSIEKLKKIKS